MQDHHRNLIEDQAEAWRQDAHLRGTTRQYETFLLSDNGDPEAIVGMGVALDEFNGEVAVARQKTWIKFRHDEMPLTARMIRDRFANPFGGK